MGLAPAKDNRIKGEHLHKNLVIVQAHEKGKAPSSQQGQPDYTWVRATVAVLSGPVSDELEALARTTELPIVLEDLRLQEAGITSRVEGKVGRYDEEGTPELAVGVIGKYKNTKGGTSYALNEPTDEQFQEAVAWFAKNRDVFPDKDPFADEAAAAKAFA